MLGTIVDIHQWLVADIEAPLSERIERDRQIATKTQGLSPRARVLAWWQALPETDKNSSGRTDAVTRGIGAALIIAGLALGAGVAAAGFAYDGRHPVNLLTLLGLLVGIPGVLLLLTLVGVVLHASGALRSARWVDGLNLTRWLFAWLHRNTHAQWFVGSRPQFRAAGAYAHWQLLVWSQWFAVGFFVAVLMTGYGLVAFSDLAFGWSSTLDPKPGTVHGFFSIIAWPWSPVLEAPSLELVEASRYFRLEGVEATPRASRQAGRMVAVRAVGHRGLGIVAAGRAVADWPMASEACVDRFVARAP